MMLSAEGRCVECGAAFLGKILGRGRPTGQAGACPTQKSVRPLARFAPESGIEA